MSTYSFVDTVEDVTGRSHVTLTKPQEGPVSLKVVLHEDINEDFDIRIQSSGIENLQMIGLIIQGIGAKLIATAGQYTEED